MTTADLAHPSETPAAAPGRGSGAAFIAVEGLRKTFGEAVAVADVSFDVDRGETLALLGPSGCGKTTILRCIAGLETPDRGRIDLGGTVAFDSASATRLAPEERQLGVVFQSYAVWPHMTVAENVGFPLRARRVAAGERRERALSILDTVGLHEWRDSPATNLSGGQQQRVALARALVHEPRLVLFDEPMSNLDAQLREAMRMELKMLQERLGFTAIYVTHDQSEALALARTIVVMNRGHVETAGPPRRVFHEPATPFVAHFMGLNVLLGEIAAPDGAADWAEIRLEDGIRLRGHLGEGARLAAGDRAVACIRRERIDVRRESDVADGAGLRAEMRAASFLGLQQEYVLALGSASIHALCPDRGLESGDRVVVDIDPQDCLILPAKEEVEQ